MSDAGADSTASASSAGSSSTLLVSALKLSNTEARESSVLAALAQDPALAKIPSGLDCVLPLHTACRKRPSLELISAMLQAHPNGVQIADAKGRLPLHWAAERRADVAVVDVLLAAHPQGAKVTDVEGWLPLHYAAANRADIAVVSALICAHPDGAQAADTAACRVPLHYAAARKASCECVAALIAAAPTSATLTDADGQSPAELASTHGLNAEAVRLLSGSLSPSLSASGMGGCGGGGGGRASAADAAGAADSNVGCSTPSLTRHYNASLRACNVWEIDLPQAALDEAAHIYASCELRQGFERLSQCQVRHQSLPSPDGVSERFFGVRAGAVAQGQPGWSSDVVWLSVDDQPTHDRFQRIFDRCDLNRHFGPLVDHSTRLQMYSVSVGTAHENYPFLHVTSLASRLAYVSHSLHMNRLCIAVLIYLTSPSPPLHRLACPASLGSPRLRSRPSMCCADDARRQTCTSTTWRAWA